MKTLAREKWVGAMEVSAEGKGYSNDGGMKMVRARGKVRIERERKEDENARGSERIPSVYATPHRAGGRAL